MLTRLHGRMHDPVEETSNSLQQELLAKLDGMEGCLNLLGGSSQLTGLQREHVASAMQYTTNLRALLEGFAECVQINRGRFVSRPQKTDVRVLLHSLASIQAPPLAERGTGFAVEVDGAQLSIPSILRIDMKTEIILSERQRIASDRTARGTDGTIRRI